MSGAGEMSEVHEGSEEVEAGEKRGGDGRPEELRNEEGEGAQERVGSAGGRPAEVEAGSSSSSSSRSSALQSSSALQVLRGAGDSEMREVQEGSEEVEAGLRAQASAASFVSAMPCSSSAREAGAEDMRGVVKVEQRCELETQSAMLKARRRVGTQFTCFARTKVRILTPEALCASLFANGVLADAARAATRCYAGQRHESRRAL